MMKGQSEGFRLPLEISRYELDMHKRNLRGSETRRTTRVYFLPTMAVLTGIITGGIIVAGLAYVIGVNP